jgi:rfaE bifunctional protein nucleotidyltransferase chain/domain
MPVTPSSKIKPIDQLRELVRRAHAAGQTVVMANGCFDLLHVGHIRYLEAAKSLGDVLVLAINSDGSVARLKGNGRPLQTENDRAEILGSLQCVDYVVIFDNATVDDVLLTLRPDIHAKGTDYTNESVPERATVLSYGGAVAIVGDEKAHSTRDLIAEIVGRNVS